MRVDEFWPTGATAHPGVHRDDSATEQVIALLRRWVLLWDSPLWSSVFALVSYGLIAAGHDHTFRPSSYAYFNLLADAILHGQLNLRLLPPETLDLSVFQGKYFLYWPPLPAVLLLPFVAIWGPGFSDVLFTLAIAAINVALVAHLLRRLCSRGILRLSKLRRGILVLFFALGTVHVTLAPFGKVWPTGQLVGLMCVLLAYVAMLRKNPIPAFGLTGLSLAGALLSRNHLLFNGLWPAYYLLSTHRRLGWRALIRPALLGLLPVVAAIGLIGIYNWLRFDSVLSNGVDYHQMGSHFAAGFARYGAFSLHYVPTNLFYQYVAYPLPIRPASREGGSLFLLSPVFFAAGWAIVHGRRSWSMWALLGTILLVDIPILLLLGTGWVQWGPRYSLDFMVPLLILTGWGLQRWSTRWLSWLTAVSIAHYLIGGLIFTLMSQGYPTR